MRLTNVLLILILSILIINTADFNLFQKHNFSEIEFTGDGAYIFDKNNGILYAAIFKDNLLVKLNFIKNTKETLQLLDLKPVNDGFIADKTIEDSDLGFKPIEDDGIRFKPAEGKLP